MSGDDARPLWRDPLIELKYSRASFLRSGGDKWAAMDYQRMRLKAMRPVSALAQADMLAMAQRCANEAQRGAAAMRRAARMTGVLA